MHPYLLTLGLTAGLMLFSHNLGFAQPIAPTTPDIPCSPTPTGAQNDDTVVSNLNYQGFFKLFDGSQMASASTPRGWWQSCQSGHGGPAIFRVDNSIPGGALYASMNGNQGGILMTNKLFDNYELLFDYWPEFGSDRYGSNRGLLNRAEPNGKSYETTLGYFGGSSIGGTWGQSGYSGRDIRPFTFAANESTIIVNTDPNYGWTYFTMRQNPTSFGCTSMGCDQASWRWHWNMNNWNQIRIKFYAGEDTSTNIHMMSYFISKGLHSWIPFSKDTTLKYATPAGFIGLLVNGSPSIVPPRRTWFKNILWRPLNINGIPLVNGVPRPDLMEPDLNPPVLDAQPTTPGKIGYDIRATKDALIGSSKFDFQIILFDMKGHALESFSGHAGKFRYPFKSKAAGWLWVEMKTRYGMEHFKINRVKP